MARKKSDSISLLKYLLIIPSVFSLASHFISLIKYEAAVMRQKITSLLVIGIFCIMFISGMWIALLTMLGVYLVSLNISMMLAITLIFLLNFFLFLIAILLIIIVKRHMAFPETREAIKEIIS